MIWYPKSDHIIDQGYNCHYRRIQGVLARNKKQLRLRRVPKLFQALQRPAISPLSKCMLSKKTGTTIAFFEGMGVIQGLSRKSHIIVLILPKHTCFGVVMWFLTLMLLWSHSRIKTRTMKLKQYLPKKKKKK